jgi:phosphoglycolate phosphatase-like HAD superfamily hydrolase
MKEWFDLWGVIHCMGNTKVMRTIHLSFDLDGTLIDSLPLMRASWEALCKKYNLKVGWSQFKLQIGLPFDAICSNLGLEDLAADLHKDYFNYNFQNIDKIEEMPGLQHLREWLARENIEWSILTSKPKKTAIPILSKFSLNPNIMICCDDTAKGKPNIEPALLLRSKVSPARKIFYIGDSIVDHLFSVNSEFEFIDFSPNGNAEYDLSSRLLGSGRILNPFISIDSLAEIPRVVL